jgi:hypothetical protein
MARSEQNVGLLMQEGFCRKGDSKNINGGCVRASHSQPPSDTREGDVA